MLRFPAKPDPRLVCVLLCLKIMGHINIPHYTGNQRTGHGGTHRVFLHVYVHMHALQCSCGGKRTASGVAVLPVGAWVPVTTLSITHWVGAGLWHTLTTQAFIGMRASSSKPARAASQNPVSKRSRPNQRKFVSQTAKIEVEWIDFSFFSPRRQGFSM